MSNVANAAVYVSWGTPVVGRENKGLEVFGEALQLHMKWKQEGKITDHHTYVATNGSYDSFGGCMVVEGEVAQLRALIDSDDWKLLELRARHLVQHFNVVHCVTGHGIMKVIEQTTAVRKQLGITG